MARQVQITLNEAVDPALKAPPVWVEHAQPDSPFWYFVNEHGEQWVARRIGDEVVFAGMDIGWEEIRVSAREADKALRYSSEFKRIGFQTFILKNTILNGSEALWIASVLAAAFALHPSGIADSATA